MFYQWLTDDVISDSQLVNCLGNCHQKDPMSEREERKPSKNMFKSTAGTKSSVRSGLCRKSKILREVLRQPFFSKSLRWWTQKSGKSLLLPPSVDTIAKIPLRGKRPFCSIIISNVLLKTIKNSKHSLRPVSHILHNFLRLYCKTFLSQGFPVKHFNFKMNWLVHFYDYLTLWCSLQSILSIHVKNYWDFLETN